MSATGTQPPAKEVLPLDGSVTLASGWHPDGEGSCWSGPEAELTIRPRRGITRIRMAGLLPPARESVRNRLTVRIGRRVGGVIGNPELGAADFVFDTFVLSAGERARHTVRLRVDETWQPDRDAAGPDRRKLGFALYRVDLEPLGPGPGLRALIHQIAIRVLSAVKRTALCILTLSLVAAARLRQWMVGGFRSQDPTPARPDGISAVLLPDDGQDWEESEVEGLHRSLVDLGLPFEIEGPFPTQVAGPAVVGARPDHTRLTKDSANWIEAVDQARYGWVLMAKPGTQTNATALRELLKRREPRVFAVAPAIETGQERPARLGTRNHRGTVFPSVLECPSASVAWGSTSVPGSWALFNRNLLPDPVTDPGYSHPSWLLLEWCCRAWQRGFRTLACPTVRTRASLPFPDSVETEADALRCSLRNPGLSPTPVVDLVRETIRREPRRQIISTLFRLIQDLRSWPTAANPGASPQLGLGQFFPSPTPGDVRPDLVLAIPYALDPPAHGGAARTLQFIQALRAGFRIHLLSDEKSLYRWDAGPWWEDLASVLLADGRPDEDPDQPPRISRIRSHSHPALCRALEHLLAVAAPELVEIDYVELSQLVLARRGRGTPWVLHLHDVLSSEPGHPKTGEDHFEDHWIRRFDHRITCCEEDAALLDDDRVSVVPCGFDPAKIPEYTVSPESPRILFVGPFRSRQNLSGIRRFAATVYPRLAAKFPGLELAIVGGKGCGELAAGDPVLRQPEIRLVEYVEDLAGFMTRFAVTINPLEWNRGACLKVIESLAAGRVCVSTDAGARGYRGAGFPGLIVVPEVEDMLAPLLHLLQDPGTRHRLERPEPDLLRPYTHEAIGQQLLLTYRSLARSS